MSFDLFLSYSTRDATAATALAAALRAEGLTVFIDRPCLRPGQPWPEELEKVLSACRAVAVLIGPGELGNWQRREKYVALNRQAREEGFPVIPVLLPGGDPPLDFLALNTWSDLRGGIDNALEIRRLAKATRGEVLSAAEEAECSAQMAALRADICPYRGLHYFREEDSRFFHGREDSADALTTAIVRHRLVTLAGASGSGKSSVIHAGAVPRLRHGAGGMVWEIATLRPNEQPLFTLAQALVPLLYPDVPEERRLDPTQALARSFASSPDVPLSQHVRNALEKQSGTDRLLLIVDQAEELFTLTRDDALRQRFLDLILAGTARDDGPLTVALTLRADFFARFLEDRRLADRIGPGQINLGPMTPAELHRAIVNPAAEVGLEFESGLVDRILSDLGAEPGTLPLLEFLLEQLWRGREGRRLSHRAYEAAGTVHGAIAQRADAIVTHMDATQREDTRRALVRLVHIGEGTQDTRRRITLADLPETERHILNRFTGQRLLVMDRAPGQGETVEVAHEALIQRWTVLRQWIDADRDFLRRRDRLTEQAELWQGDAQDPSRLLPPGRPLAEGIETLEQRGAELPATVVAFITASRKADDVKRAAERAQLKRRQRFATAALIIFTLLAGLFGWQWQIAQQQEKIAREQSELAQQREEEAGQQTRQAQSNQSLLLAKLANFETESGNATNGVLLALEALPRQGDVAKRPLVAEAELSLRQALLELRERRVLRGHEEAVTSAAFSPDRTRVVIAPNDDTAGVSDVADEQDVAGEQPTYYPDVVPSAAFSPDGTRIVTASWDKTARLWDTASGQELTVLRGHGGVVNSAAFSPDGGRVVTASNDGTARLWDTASGQELTVLRGHGGVVSSAAFSPDGRRVVTASNDDTARVWDATTGQQRAVLRVHGHQSTVTSAAFSPDGRRVVTASWDKTARVWDAASGKELIILRGHEAAVTSAAFSPDGTRVVTASNDGTARLWDAASGQQRAVLRGHEAAVTSAAFSPDGGRVVTASWDKTARLWDAASGKELIVLRGHEGGVNSAAFSPDGRRVVTASFDGTARLWDTPSSQELVVFRGHERSFTSAAFSPDGRRVVIASWDKTARLWDAASGKELIILRGHEEIVTSAAFSPDGTRVVTASNDGTARLWDAASGQQRAVLRGHEEHVISAAFSPDGTRVVTASKDNTVRLWDAASGKELAVLSGDVGRIISAAFSPDGRRIVIASWDKTVRLWDATSGEERAVLRGHESRVGLAAFSPDGRRVVTASGGRTARLLDATSGQELAVLHEHESRPAGLVAFSPDGTHVLTEFGGKYVLTISSDNTARLWDASSGALQGIMRHTDAVISAQFSADGKTIRTLTRDGLLYRWSVLPHALPDLIAYACSVVPRELTAEQRQAFYVDVAGNSAPPCPPHL